MEASEPVEQYISEIDPDILNKVDSQNRSSFIEQNSSSRYHLNLKQQMLAEADLGLLQHPRWSAL